MLDLRGTVVVLVLWCSASVAAAQSPLATAVAAYENGEFDEAARALDAAEAGDALTRAELVTLLTHRVLVAQALVDETTLETAMLQLATLEPEALEGRAPPPILRRMATAVERTGGERLGVDVEHRRTTEGVLVDAHVRGDLGGLVRRVRLRARVRGTEAWQEPAEQSLTVAGVDPEQVEVIAEAIGPGGAVLAFAGSEARPLRLTRPTRDGAFAAPTAAASDDTGLHVALVTVAVVVALGGVGLGVGLAVTSQGDAPIEFTGPPLVRW